MKYYRVRPEFDNKKIYKRSPSGCLNYLNFLIANELYTEKEYIKLVNNSVYNIEKCFDIVTINKNKTHFFFGARFENTEN